MEFACDPVDQQTIRALALAASATEAREPWLLVDAALLDEDKLEARVHHYGWQCHSALALSPLAAFGKQAPQLVRLAGSPDTIERGLSALARVGQRAPAFSMLHTSAALEELQRLFAYLAQALVDGDMPVHCRFADTRVLPSLLSVLSPTQALRVRQTVQAWHWWDRQSTLAQWPSDRVAEQTPAVGITADEAEHMQLNAQQFGAMLEASEADSVFTQLLDTTPELVPAERRGAFHARLQSQLTAANGYAITQAPDRLQFVVLSLSCGDQFHLHPALQQTWQAVQQGGARLSDLMAAWSDEVWDALSPKREAAA